MKKLNTKTVICFILTVFLLFTVVPGMVLTVQAEATIIPTGDYPINADGEYQLDNNYSGAITIANNVNTVTVTGSADGADHYWTKIIVAGGRSQAIQLTINNFKIYSSNSNDLNSSNGPAIDFSSAGGSLNHQLLISGTCLVTGSNSYAGIHVPEGINLTINKATGFSDDQAILNVNGTHSGSAIGGNAGTRWSTFNSGGGGGNITIDGGTITARGGYFAAGIGGGCYGVAGNIIINGGTVSATGGQESPGIGNGFMAYSGGSISINGGTVTAQGGLDSSGIGGSYFAGVVNSINVSGGIIKATGGWFPYGGGGGGAGIGSGAEGSGECNITISGTPTIIATAGGSIAEHIGQGEVSTSSITLKNAAGDNLSYLRFYTGVSGAKLIVDGTEYLTSNESLWCTFIPRSGEISYTASKVGYAAVKGTQNVSLVSHGINIPLPVDNTAPTVSVNPSIMQTGTGTDVTCDNYGIYGSLYLVEKGETNYTNKAALDGAVKKVFINLENPTTSAAINTAEYVEGSYQVYVVDSAENVSSPNEIEIDNTPPILSSAVRVDNTHIMVTLNEERASIAQNNDAGFTIHEIGNPGITYAVSSVVQDNGNGRNILLTLANMGVSGKEGVAVKYTSGGNGIVADLAGNVMASDEVGVTIAAWDITPPTVGLSHNNAIDIVKQGDEITITAVFNEGMADTPHITIANGGVAEASMVNDSGDQITWIYTWTVPEGNLLAEVSVSGDDIAGNSYSGDDCLVLAIDNTAPEIGNRIITASGVTTRSMDLAWEAASDESTAQENLQYKIVRSTGNNIDSVNDAETNGVLVQDWTTNLTEKNVIGLAESKTYYFNIIVRDEAGNKSLYNTLRTRTEKSFTPAPKPTITIGSEILLVEVTSDSSTGNAAVSTGEELLERLFEQTQADGSGRKTILLEMPEIDDASSYTLEAPILALSSEGTQNEILFTTPFGTIGMPMNMLSGLDNVAGEKAAITIGQGDKTNLPSDVSKVIGDRPLVRLTLTADGKQVAWNNPNTPVTLSIPYTPSDEDLRDPEHITIWYIDGDGNTISVPSGRYDPVTGTVTFTTTHFSRFAVVYVSKSFMDLAKTPWAKKQIEALSAKGIVNGRTETEFAPTAGITRAEYVSALVRTLGLSTKFDANFSDVKLENVYYNEIGIAKKLGITGGVGNNSFKPENTITRQEMLVMAERTLRNLKIISQTGTMEDLKQFNDKTQLAAYAVNSIASLVKEGLVQGSNGLLNMASDTTRAEAAVFLYRIYNN